MKPANRKEDRVDRRKAMHQTGERQVVVVMRERGGQSAATVAKSEKVGANAILDTVAPGSVVYADEGSGWDVLHRRS